MDPAVDIVGAYRVRVDEELIDQTLDVQHGGLELSQSDSRLARRQVVELLSGVVLIEVVVSRRDQRFDVGDFQQLGPDQAAYDEAFLSADGTDVLSRGLEVPPVEPLRVAFFLHFFDPAAPLQSSYGALPVPPLQDLPPRLRDLVPYEPIDFQAIEHAATIPLPKGVGAVDQELRCPNCGGYRTSPVIQNDPIDDAMLIILGLCAFLIGILVTGPYVVYRRNKNKHDPQRFTYSCQLCGYKWVPGGLLDTSGPANSALIMQAHQDERRRSGLS